MDTVICHESRTVTCRCCHFGWTLRGDAERMLLTAEEFRLTHRCGARKRQRYKRPKAKPLSRWQSLFANIKF